MSKAKEVLELLSEGRGDIKSLIEDLKDISKRLSDSNIEDTLALLKANIEKIDKPN